MPDECYPIVELLVNNVRTGRSRQASSCSVMHGAQHCRQLFAVRQHSSPYLLQSNAAGSPAEPASSASAYQLTVPSTTSACRRRPSGTPSRRSWRPCGRSSQRRCGRGSRRRCWRASQRTTPAACPPGSPSSSAASSEVRLVFGDSALVGTLFRAGVTQCQLTKVSTALNVRTGLSLLMRFQLRIGSSVRGVDTTSWHRAYQWTLACKQHHHIRSFDVTIYMTTALMFMLVLI